ncbi:hypothetical protein Q4555_07540 [Octadecabacter sp. 1_MG-2023]|uniref:hypothetical protein n=1 Tax=unclassified Octadecabacter TaxID=196158 RepID=UPI001C09CA80|nr:MULTISPECIES: hypothetical protein [unclassified Octadecabacter]MBU2994195.1 hypothetical protein [Octadecabacter sp. B2R22]MDO6734516.1 hypothetical protein [Octadecabacter sp. 1_MG-2023]
MAKAIRLVHTAQVHVARFDALRDAIAPDVTLTHVVRPDLLDRARVEGVTDPIRAELISELALDDPDPTICTCTTLGPAAEAAGAIRIDRPMMDKAAKLGGRVLLAVVLESTVAACQDALGASIQAAGTGTQIDTLVMPSAWPLFESGDMDGFAQFIADRVNAHLSDHSAVVLAQVSMTDAAGRIDHPTVLTAPELTLRFALGA